MRRNSLMVAFTMALLLSVLLPDSASALQADVPWAFLVDESAQGSTDLNGDGDASDNVLHVFDAASGKTANLGLASFIFFNP